MIAAFRNKLWVLAAPLVCSPLVATGSAEGQACYSTPCLPPPCAADGICHPKRETWGYYAPRWNRWPGDYDDAFPSPADQPTGASPLPAVQEIPPELEDQQAPPPSDAELEEEGGDSIEEEGEGAADIDLPPLPPLRPLGTPPGAGADPPPALPRFNPPGQGLDGPRPQFTPPRGGQGPGLDSGFSYHPVEPSLAEPAGLQLNAPRARGAKPKRTSVSGDAPPALPASFTKLLNRSNIAQAAYQEASVPRRVAPAVHRLPVTE